MRPLRRKPKQLSEQPALYEPARGGSGLALSSGDRRRDRSGPSRPGGTASGTTDEPADLIPLADLETESSVDQLTRSRARQIARRLAVPRPPRDRRSRRGVGELAPPPWGGGSGGLGPGGTPRGPAGKPHPGGAGNPLPGRGRRGPARRPGGGRGR